MSARKRPQNGKRASTPTAPRSATKLSWPPDPQLARLLATVYNHYQKLEDPVANAKNRHDFVFHMTDWLDDLQLLTEVYKHPDKTGKDSADSAVYRFLIHALPHLMEAGRLLEGREIRNPFLNMESEP